MRRVACGDAPGGGARVVLMTFFCLMMDEKECYSEKKSGQPDFFSPPRTPVLNTRKITGTFYPYDDRVYDVVRQGRSDASSVQICGAAAMLLPSIPYSKIKQRD